MEGLYPALELENGRALIGFYLHLGLTIHIIQKTSPFLALHSPGTFQRRLYTHTTGAGKGLVT